MTKIRGPRDGALTATFIDRTNMESPSEILSDSSLLLLLSILGNKACEDGFLGAMLEGAVSQHRMVYALVVDKPQWHNLKGLSVTADQQAMLEAQAIAAGTLYLQKNMDHFLAIFKKRIPEFDPIQFKYSLKHQSIDVQISLLNKVAAENNIGLVIMRWNDWLTPEYLQIQNNVRANYQSSPSLIASVEETAAVFAKRHAARKTSTENDLALQLCLDLDEKTQLWQTRSTDFLIDESAGVYTLVALRRIKYIAYAGKISKAFVAARSHLISETGDTSVHPYTVAVEKKSDIAIWLDIEFSRVKRPPCVLNSPKILQLYRVQSEVMLRRTPSTTAVAKMDLPQDLASTSPMKISNNFMFFYRTKKPLPLEKQTRYFMPDADNRNALFKPIQTQNNAVPRTHSPSEQVTLDMLHFLHTFPLEMQVSVLSRLVHEYQPLLTEFSNEQPIANLT